MAVLQPEPDSIRLEPWTVDELADWPEGGGRVELWDGALHMSPVPRPQHAMTVDAVRDILRAALPGDLRALENLGISPSPTGLLVPDITVVWRAAALAAVSYYVDPSAVLLALEVESPSSRVMDRTAKPAMYAEAGIPTYVRVVMNGPEVHVYRLVAGTYSQESFRPGQTLTLPEPLAVTFDPAQLSL